MMDPTKVQKQRAKYPGTVPVICVSYPNPDAPNSTGEPEIKKFMIPHIKTGAEFTQILREKCDWAAPHSRVWIKKGHKPIPEFLTGKDLDSPEYKAPDDVLYIEVERQEKEPNAKAKADAAKAMKAEKEAMSRSVHEFKLNSASEDLAIQKVMTDGSDQAARARLMKKKHPDRVPVLVNQAQSPGLPRIEKKLLVPRNMKVQDLRKSLASKIEDADIPWDKVRMLMAGIDVQEDECMGLIYDTIVDNEDAGLHLTLELERDEDEPYTLSVDPVEFLDEPEELPTLQGPTRQDVENLEMSLLQARDEIDQADRRREEEERRADRAEQHQLQALASLDIAERKMEDLEQAKQNFEAELEEVLANNLQLQQDCDNTQKLLNAAQAALRQSGRESQALQDENMVLKEKLEAMEKERETFRRLFKNEEEKIVPLKEMCTKLKKQLALTEDARASISRNFTNVEDQLQKKDEETGLLKSELEAMAYEKAVLLNEVNTLKASLAAKEEEEEQLKASLAAKEEEEDFCIVGWNDQAQPVASQECSALNVTAPQ